MSAPTLADVRASLHDLLTTEDLVTRTMVKRPALYILLESMPQPHHQVAMDYVLGQLRLSQAWPALVGQAAQVEMATPLRRVLLMNVALEVEAWQHQRLVELREDEEDGEAEAGEADRFLATNAPEIARLLADLRGIEEAAWWMESQRSLLRSLHLHHGTPCSISDRYNLGWWRIYAQ